MENNKQPQQNFTITLRSFESKIYYMNGMYNLPIAPYPQTQAAIKWQREQDGDVDMPGTLAIHKRLVALKKILQDELNEIDEITEKLARTEYTDPMDLLVDVADLMGDLIVYCASEMVRFGIPPMDTLDIIMNSNFSKLDADGKPIIKDGKFLKGPFYWKPEPAIRALLEMRVAEFHSYQQRVADLNEKKEGEV